MTEIAYPADTPGTVSPEETAVPTLFAWAGEMPAFTRLMEQFYARVPADPLLGPLFAHMDAEHARYVALFVAEVFGGPDTYRAEHGGHPHMVARHMSRSLTEAQRHRWVELLLTCADESGLPDDPEFRSALVGYLEWGSRLAVINSQPSAAPPPPDSPMPVWGWGEVKGPYRG